VELDPSLTNISSEGYPDDADVLFFFCDNTCQLYVSYHPRLSKSDFLQTKLKSCSQMFIPNGKFPMLLLVKFDRLKIYKVME